MEERLNPIVWKELRQGLKSRAFIATFLGLQGAMVISMLTYAAASGAGSDQGFADGMFWFFLGVMLLLMMPLRALGALHGEIKGNTLDMLFLSRMTSWDIAFGKWLALLMQIGLMVCAILPYLVVRYYMGSVDVTSDLILLFTEVVASSLLVAIGVGLSSWTSKVMRGLLIFGALSSLYMLPVMMFAMFDSRSGGMFRFWDGWDILAWLIVVIAFMLFAVEYGASQIAPPAENHSARKRGLAALVTVVLLVYGLFIEQSGAPVAIGLAIMIPIMIDAVCEPMYAIPTLYNQHRRWKGLRWFLYPGWPGGLLASCVVFVLMVGAGTYLEGAEFLGGSLALFNVLALPVLLIQLVPFLKNKPLASYIGIQFSGLILLTLLSIMFEVSRFVDIEPEFAILFPHAGLFVLMDQGADAFEDLTISITTFVILAGCIAKAVPIWRQMNQLSQQGLRDD